MRGTRTDARRRRHDRVRKNVHGSAERPRLAVFRSNRYIYAQIMHLKFVSTEQHFQYVFADIMDISFYCTQQNKP